MFLRRKKSRTGYKNPNENKVALFIAKAIITLQSRAAARLSHWEHQCSDKQKKLLLLLFCLVFGSYCIFLLLRSIL